MGGVVVTFEEYVRLRGERLVRLARLLVRDPYLAEDLVQEVLAKAFVRWNRIVTGGDPDVYLRRMLINASVSWWRRRSSSELATGGIGERPDRTDIGDDAANRDAAWRLVAGLPPRQRATVILRYFEDLDDATIAEILQCSTVTVRTQAMRALATLRGRLAAPAATSGRNGR